MQNSMRPNETILDKIYVIRNQKVLLDRDLAQLYGIETKRLNEAVKRNISRFPDDFMFQLNDVEFETLKSQFATSSWGGNRKRPFAFTEHGILMLSSVIHSELAISVNIQIMRLFTQMRQWIMEHSEVQEKIHLLEQKVENHDKNIALVFSYLDELSEAKPVENRKPIGYKN
ncbi:ORF6N domain-containing protein [Flavobacterium sp.]|uniref:ORF6N domain-containing protein n=1 Tax=Flavobacterium sp. TaxID=239 RepID=UPI00262646D0|nr:ORF6N domain-containing protein [Flavobacterium sp.]